MDERFVEESRRLVRMWERGERGELRDYLVRDVEDPRINVQSILTRHFLLEALFPGELAEARYHELWFGAVMNWVRRVRRRYGEEALTEIYGALLAGRTEVRGVGVPAYVAAAARGLPRRVEGVEIENYVETAALGSEAGAGERWERACGTLAGVWRGLLGARGVGERLRVVEAACGSANDYRYIYSYGMARFLDYRGFDLTPGNVANAREMFPGVDFRVGNVLEIEAGDGAFDWLYVHDLFEHLSIAALERAVAEVCRVTRRGMCLGLFRAREAAEHVVVPHEGYYFNTLSVPRMVELLKGHGGTTEVLWVSGVLERLFGSGETHNALACTLMVWMEGG